MSEDDHYKELFSRKNKKKEKNIKAKKIELTDSDEEFS